MVGPRADTAQAMLGCYSFPMHVGVHHPDVPVGVDMPTLADALRTSSAAYDVVVEEGVPVVGGGDEGIAAAVRAAARCSGVSATATKRNAAPLPRASRAATTAARRASHELS